VIDCDVHNTVPSIDALVPYLDTHWQEYVERSGFTGPDNDSYPPNAPTSRRPGTAAGTSLEQIRGEALTGDGLAILTCLYGADSVHNPYLAVALAQAANDWQVAEWLEPEPRLRASIVVPASQPELAAGEIDRVGSHPGFVQVLLPVRSSQPYGTLHFRPVFEAAVRNDLAVALHFGGGPGVPPTGVGWPSFYIEEYAGMANIFQTQVMSLLVEGVFDRFPTLRVALVESGFAWLPAFLWRVDKEWKGLRREVPWVRRLPSEYVHEHMRLTLRPLDCPLDLLPRVVDRLGCEELLMFASDYPHNHPEPDDEVLTALPEALRPGVAATNAAAFYGLGNGQVLQ
jgi:hypothetical protein